MKKFKVLLKILLILALIHPLKSGATDWKEIASSNSATYFIDVDSVTFYTQRPYIKNFWVLSNESTYEISYDGKRYLSSKARNELNCQTREIRFLSLYGFDNSMGEGHVVFSHKFANQNWQDVVPGSIADAYMQFLCSEKDFNYSQAATTSSYEPSTDSGYDPNEINNPLSYASIIHSAVAQYAVGENSDLAACMQNKVKIFIRRLGQYNPDKLVQESTQIINEATKATISTCRAEENALHQGPSYDCTKSTIDTELAICNNSELSKLDVQFSNAVIAAKMATPYKQAITTNLKQWIKERNQCGGTFSCIKASYNKGMRYIEGL